MGNISFTDLIKHQKKIKPEGQMSLSNISYAWRGFISMKTQQTKYFTVWLRTSTSMNNQPPNSKPLSLAISLL
jgi:hypothetical protein